MKSTIRIPLDSNQRYLGEVIFTLRNEGICFDMEIDGSFYIITLR
jgi:hypothetical protein